jgi:5'-phosphate synthase pdxT subunit
MAVGVLALQGDFAAHEAVLRRLGEPVREVRSWRDLPGLRALVLPGGESTTLLRLMDAGPWFDALRAFHDGGGALLGTCAGAILLAREVDPSQPSLGLLDVSVSRNAYGRQVDSFEARLDAPVFGDPLLGVFIRAPRFIALGPQVEVLARLDGEPVLVRHRHVLAATFHPEIAGDDRVHRLLLE